MNSSNPTCSIGGHLSIPLCLLAINVDSDARCSVGVEISEDEARQIRQRVFVPYHRYVPRGDMPCRAPKMNLNHVLRLKIVSALMP